MWWQYTGSSSKSDAEMQRLVDKVILDPNFRKEELRGMSVTREKTRLDEFIEDGGDCFTPETGWRQVSVMLKLPKARTKYAKEEDIPTVTNRPKGAYFFSRTSVSFPVPILTPPLPCLMYHHLTFPFPHYRLPFVLYCRACSHDSVLFPHVAIVPSCI